MCSSDLATLRLEGKEESVAHVMVPTVPLPTTGWALVIPVRDLVFLDITVDAALRVLFSGGAVSPRMLEPRRPGA